MKTLTNKYALVGAIIDQEFPLQVEVDGELLTVTEGKRLHGTDKKMEIDGRLVNVVEPTWDGARTHMFYFVAGERYFELNADSDFLTVVESIGRHEDAERKLTGMKPMEVVKNKAELLDAMKAEAFPFVVEIDNVEEVVIGKGSMDPRSAVGILHTAYRRSFAYNDEDTTDQTVHAMIHDEDTYQEEGDEQYVDQGVNADGETVAVAFGGRFERKLTAVA